MSIITEGTYYLKMSILRFYHQKRSQKGKLQKKERSGSSIWLTNIISQELSSLDI